MLRNIFVNVTLLCESLKQKNRKKESLINFYVSPHCYKISLYEKDYIVKISNICL